MCLDMQSKLVRRYEGETRGRDSGCKPGEPCFYNMSMTYSL